MLSTNAKFNASSLELKEGYNYQGDYITTSKDLNKPEIGDIRIGALPVMNGGGNRLDIFQHGLDQLPLSHPDSARQAEEVGGVKKGLIMLLHKAGGLFDPVQMQQAVADGIHQHLHVFQVWIQG